MFEIIQQIIVWLLGAFACLAVPVFIAEWFGGRDPLRGAGAFWFGALVVLPVYTIVTILYIIFA